MPFDPDAYLAQTTPDAALKQADPFDPDAYLAGTAESYGNLAQRGALPEGIWARAQGLVETPRTLASVVFAGLEKFAQLKGDPEILARVRENRAALQDPSSPLATELAAVPVVKVGDWLADAYQQSRDRYRRKHPVRPEIAESLSGQFVQGLGQAVPAVLQGLTMPATLPAMAAGQIHQEALDDARQKGATDDQARLAAAAYLPAATLDYASDRLLIGKLLKPLVGKVSIGQAVKHLLAQAGTGGGTEAVQQVWLNAVEKAGFKPDQTLTDGVLDSFLVGTAVDGTTTAGGMATSAGTRRLAERADAREAAALARWAKSLGAQPENPLPATETSIVSGAKTNGDTATVAGNPLPEKGASREDQTPPAEVGQPSAGTPAPASPPSEIAEILATEKAQIEAQRAEAERRARSAALQQRAMPDLIGEALRPRVADLATKTDLEKHDFWRSMQGLAQTLAGLQTTTTEGQQARRRQLSLEEMREQAGMIFAGAQPELLDAIALKLHGSKPAESVAALRDFYRYAGQQRTPYAAAAHERDAAVAAQRQAEETEARRRQEEMQAAKRRAAQERARIRDTGRDLEGRVVDWTAVPDADLERLAAEPEDAAQVEIAGARAEIERRANEESGTQPLTRDQQIRLLERYGGINPDHPVHRGELATIRESDLGKNRKLWRADGASLDRIAEALRQEVQNGPETEADVLAWLSELAAGRAPKLYERGDMDRAEYARSLPPGQYSEDQVAGRTRPAAPAPRSYDYTVRRPRPDEQDANGQVMKPTMWGLYNDEDEYIGYLGKTFDEAREAAIQGIAESEDIKPGTPKWNKIAPRINFENGTTPAPAAPAGWASVEPAGTQPTSGIDYIVAPISEEARRDLDINAEEAARSVGIYDATSGLVVTSLGQGFGTKEFVALLRNVNDDTRSDAQIMAAVTGWNTPPTPELIRQIRAGVAQPPNAPARHTGYGLRPPQAPAAEDIARRTAIGKQAQQLAKAQEAWRHPGTVTTARDMVDVARFYSTPQANLRVQEGLHEIKIIIERPNNARDSLTVTERNGDVTVYAGGAGSNKQPEGGGSAAYQAIFTWAHNNGYRVFGSSLSNINQFRRTINMLSSALRHGSTDHLVPYSTQGILGWIDGNTANNIGAMLEAASTMAAERVPELGRLTYDLKADMVVDQTNGHRFTASDLARFCETHRLGDRYGIGSATARLLLFGRAAMAAHGAGRRLGPAKAIVAAARGGLQRVLYARGEGADEGTIRRGTDHSTQAGESDALSVGQRKAKEREERRMRRVAPRLFADLDVRIANVEQALRSSGYNGEIPDGVEAAYLPRLRAEKDLIVVGLRSILRGLGLPRMLHESGHAYWRMLTPETRAALQTAYQRDLREQWSPLWKDGELATDVSQQDILEGTQLGLEEWFSELMAALNADWAQRRSLPRVPGWIGDLAAKLRDLVQRLFGAVADHKGLQGDARLRFLTEDFRAFLTRGFSAQRTATAGAQFARSEAQFAQGTLDLDTALGIDLPAEIAGLVPNYQDRKLRFQSRLDKALYYVGAPGNTELRARLVASLQEQTGMTEGQIRSLARSVRDRLPAIVRSQPQEGAVRVPEIAPALAEDITGVRWAQSQPLPNGTAYGPTAAPTREVVAWARRHLGTAEFRRRVIENNYVENDPENASYNAGPNSHIVEQVARDAFEEFQKTRRPRFAQSQEAQAWEDSLKPDERAALRWWSEIVYNVGAVRDYQAGYVKHLTPEARRHAQAFDSAINRAPAMQATVWRGARISSPDTLKVGAPYQFGMAASASLDRAVAEEFSDYGPPEGHPVLFEVHAKNAVDLTDTGIEEFRSQKEVLLRKESTYTVRSVRQDSGITHAVLEETTTADMATQYRQPDGSYLFRNMVRGVADKPNDHGVAGKGPYWSFSERAAKEYARKGGRIVRRDVHLRNPLVLTYGELNALQERTVGKMVTGFEAEPAEQFDRYLRSQGHDGVVLFDPEISKTEPSEVVEFRTDGVRFAAPQAARTDTPEFRAWFGQSKVVDAKGKPLVVYHGTQSHSWEWDEETGRRKPSAAFTQFHTDFSGSRTDEGYLGKGFYFTDSSDVARWYAAMTRDDEQAAKQEGPWLESKYGSRVGAFYLSLQNPLIIDSKPDHENPYSKRLQIEKLLGFDTGTSANEITRSLREKGHDGVICRFPAGGFEIVVFDPENIKSATANRGTFDRTNPDIRYAAPQKIVAAKQVDATPTSEDRARADKLIDIMPAFQGGKYQMAHPAASLIRQQMPEPERAKIESIVDYFGGGGWWGSYLALTHFPNVRRITVNEFDTLRAAKIRLLHEAPEKVAQFLDEAAVREALQQVREKAAADEKTSGSALAARLHILPSILPDFPHAAGLAGLLKDAAMSARGRAEDAAGAKTAAASLDKLVRIALRDAKHAAEGAAELRRRGVVVEVVQGDAYARSPETGDRTLAVFDPPYYLTTGYDGGIVPLGTYEKTAAALQNFAASGNAILYTDSGWWLDAPEKAEQTADIFSGEQADRAALSRIVDSLNAVGIVPVEGRHEIIGINRPGERHGLDGLHRQPGRAEGAGSSGQADRQLFRRRGGQTAGDQTAGSVDAGASGEARSVPAALDARERFEAADAKVRELEAKLAALAEGNSQENDVEEQGAELQRQLAEARRERNRAQAEATTADSLVYTDPVSQELAKNPTVRSLRVEKQELTDALSAAKKENQPTEALLDRRDAINADLETIRRQAEQGTFPLTTEPPVAFGDANPPRTDAPLKTAPGADEPDHLRPMRILNWEPYTDAQLTERLARLRQRRDAIGDDDLEAGRRLTFLADLVRDTREELEARRAALELQAERDAIGEAQPAPAALAAGEDEALAREQSQDAQAALDAEIAAAIPDAPEESYPVRDNVAEIGAQVSAATLEPKNGLRRWTEKLGELLRGFRSAVPELPTFQGAERFATFREGLRLLHGLDEVVQHEAQEAVADIVAPLQAHSTTEARSKQARLQELRRQAAASPAAKAARAAEIARLEQEMQGDAWWIFQNVVLYGDLFTRSRLYRRDDGTPIGLPGGLNPAEAEHLFKTWLQRAHAHPQAKAIMEARERHKAFVQRIAGDLQERGFVFAEGSNTNYFPHVMIEQWDGDIAHVKAGTAKDFRGYLVTPTGSAKPIETDYLKAMYYHAVQVLAHNKRADILRDYVAREDIKQQLVDEAAKARRRDPDAPPVNWRQIFHTQYADKYALYSPDPDEIPLHPELVIDRDALAHRLGVVLGSGPLQEELKKAGLTHVPLQPAEIQEMLVAGSRELWVLPTEVAEALRGVSRRAKKTDNLVTKILGGAQGLWKRNILFAPWNWLRFEFNNLVSDTEKILVADPAMAAGLIDAGRDVYAFISGSKDASDDVREAFRLGVLDTLTAAEVQALRAQRPFEAFETKGERNTRLAVNRLTSFFSSSRWNTMGWSKLREATFRFAKYQADLERMRHGSTPRYGGAYWKNVEAMQRVGAPEAIHEQDRTGRLIGRQGPGTGPQASTKPYAIAWEQGGRRFEESYATKEERAKKREALEAQQRQADTALVARKAAAISRATFGDYGELTPNGNGIRRIFVPFFAWTEVNFRYHANLLRNMRDMLATGQIDRKAAASQLAKQTVALGSRAAMGMVLRLALPYLAVGLWNGMQGDDEDDLSEEDRRRFHLILGREDDGKIRVVYLPTAFSDVLKWFSGNRAAALVGDVAAGRTDWQAAAGQFTSNLVPDFLNNTIGSAGPIWKIPYTLASGKSTFPDVTDQRTIPSYDMGRVILGQMTDQFTAEMIELAINKDYVASRDAGEWAQQAILQVRRRDPESWAFYAIKDKAAQFEEAKTGRREQRAAYDAPDAQVLRQFRRAIYQADVPTAVRMYQRLLELGYTAERFESSVRAQDPLYGLPKALRDEFVRGLNPSEREQLRSAYRYYLRMEKMEGTGRRLFPSREASERTRARYQASPRLDVLHDEIQRALTMQNNKAEANRQADKSARKALR